MSTSEDAYDDIFNSIIPEAIELFRQRSVDYSGGPAFLLLGSRGQFSDINRKFWKLYKSIWEDRPLLGEQPEEIVQDFIGHCFLLLYCLRQEAIEEEPSERMIARLQQAQDNIKASTEGTGL